MDGIIVDTSSILFALSKNVDVFSAVEDKLGLRPIISRGVLNELSKISETRTARGRHAKIALGMIAKHGVKTDPDATYVDDWILSAAKGFDGVCSNDTNLRRKLRELGVPVYSISAGGDLR